DSVLAYDALGVAGLPDRDIQVAIGHLYRRATDEVGPIAVVKLLPSDVEAGLFVQRFRVPLMQSLVMDVVDNAPQLRVAVLDLTVDGRGVQTEARITSEVAEFPGIRHTGDP